MKFTKRQLYNRAAVLGIGAALLTIPCEGMMHGAYAYNHSPEIPLFGTTLRGVGPGGIPVALPGPLPAPVTGVKHYDINIVQFQDQITPLSSGLGPTTIWGYSPLKGLGGNIKPTHLGGIIIGKGKNPNDPNDVNEPIQITFRNQLFVSKHIIPVDTTQMGNNQQINKAAIHLHGGVIPWISDGGPFDWFGPTNTHGESFLNNQVLNPTAPPGGAEYYYPLNQSARFLWYHDHAHGTTRLNAYAGLATALLVRDNFEAGLVANNGLPAYIESGGREIPLIFQDKIFVGADINTQDPGWSSMVQTAATRPGSIWYAHTYEINQPDGTGRWDWDPSGQPPPDPSAIPEFFGDTMLVNGTTFPEANVEARRYRLRMLNACNARFLNLQLYYDDGTPDGITLDAAGHPTNQPFVNAATGDASWLQIGTEGGFLPNPMKVTSNVPFLITDTAFGVTNPSLLPTAVQKSLVVSPAERPDLIVDFSLAVGRKVILYNDAPSPFPLGDDRNDFFPGWNPGTGAFGVGNPINGVTTPGKGPNTRVLMRFNVTAATGAPDLPLNISTTSDFTPGIDPTLLPVWGLADDQDPRLAAIPRRFISLNENFDDYGRLTQIIGNAQNPYGSPYDGSSTYIGYGLPPATTPTSVPSSSEDVVAGTTEIWEIFNNTGDMHPMHFHLVNVQVINRQAYNPDGTYVPFGPTFPPDANEVGWKETVSMPPGMVTRVIMKWDMTAAAIVKKDGITKVTTKGMGTRQLPIVNGVPPVSPRTGTHEYVWHCHILEHEEHDMMHTINVTP